jgi:hypothetical protein
MRIPQQKRFFFHMNNTKPDNPKTTTESLSIKKFARVPHSPYSPNITPSNFYLFGTIKQSLCGCQGKAPRSFKGTFSEYCRALHPCGGF